MKRVSSGASPADLQRKFKGFGLRRLTYWGADPTFHPPAQADRPELPWLPALNCDRTQLASIGSSLDLGRTNRTRYT